MKNKKTTLMIVGGVIALLLIGTVIFYNIGISSTSSKSEEVIVEVAEGATASTILNKLDEAGLVNNKLCAKVFLKLNSYEIKRNTYILNKNMSLSKMYSIMQEGDFDHVLKSKFQVLEGTTIPQVAKNVAKIVDQSKEDVLKAWADETYLKSLAKEYWFIDEKTILNKELMFPLEGYLYPQTYYVTEEKPTIESVTKLALDMMDKELTPYKEDIKKMNWTPHQFLTFVSIVERETGKVNDDTSKIAGVLMNRLEVGMPLQCDSTVNYALQRTSIVVSIDMTKNDSKYNTYKYVGLPTGPISVVPSSTMKECVNYANHDFKYFFSDKDGKTYFSKDYDEHKKIVKEKKWY